MDIKNFFKDKKNIRYTILLIITLVFSFIVYFNVKAADDTNQVAMKYVKMTKIETGTSRFDTSDGLNVNPENGEIVSYNAGYDSSSDNRIVRSFDKIVYHFNFQITGKSAARDLEEKTVDIVASIDEETAKYVTFDPNKPAGEISHKFSFSGIDSYGETEKTITLYVLGAPNKLEIKPKFDIQESTNNDSNYKISLGYNNNNYYYEYDSEKGNKYSTSSNISGFSNYMPTYVSSRVQNIRAEVIGSSESQKVTYNDKVGRYVTFVYALRYDGYGVGNTMPSGEEISLPGTYGITGNKNLIYEDSWVRRYDQNKVGDIEPVVVNAPYSGDSSDTSRYIKYAGDPKLTVDESGKSLSLKIENYKTIFNTVSNSASNNAISNRYIGTYAVTFFSPRETEDGKNDINYIISLSDSTAKTISDNNAVVNMNISGSGSSATVTNKYYEIVDYSLSGEFYTTGNDKISMNNTNGYGSSSKGEELVFKTTFNYKKTNSDQGLKEVIKVDPNAYRVIPYGKNSNVKITIEDDKTGKLKESDFEVKFLTGDWNNSNYEINNSTEVDGRISAENSGMVMNQCASLTSSIGTLSVDQVQNLYGGPCIKAKDETETEFENPYKANDEEKELPITKVIVQTKEGVKLPDNVKVIVDVGVRVRNVSDLTQTYQITSVAMSSDYDEVLTYYSPMISDSNNSITNKDNYIKTTYMGNTISNIDTDSPWGDCLKIVNFTSREIVTVTNKTKDGSTKKNYNTYDGETLNYKVSTIINDDNVAVGADDVWYIDHLVIRVTLPNTLNYVSDADLIKPSSVDISDSGTVLTYIMPYTKPNQKVKDIYFNATLSPKISGVANEVTVSSTVEAININGEQDFSYFGYLTGSFTIYATGITNVIVSQKIGEQGSVVEKDSEFSYVISAYNNTGNNVTEYDIVDILPGEGDGRNSKFSGNYEVKVTMPSSQGHAKLYCTKTNTKSLTSEIENKNNNFEECDKIANEFVPATAIKISNISLGVGATLDDIVITVKPKNNNYSDRYINSAIGGSKTYSVTETNKIKVRVISRTISGRVFWDVNEDGIEDSNDKYLANIPMNLYKLDSDNKMKKVNKEISTDSKGYYEFKDLDVGRYLVRGTYDSDKYNLTYRYNTEDTEHDSDAYKIDQNTFEISSKHTPDESFGILVSRDIEKATDMNAGLYRLVQFGFDIEKYITQIDLNSNGLIQNLKYDNQSKVSLSVKNSAKATASVYYGIKITNTSGRAGYAKLITEDIPAGMIFDSNDPYNSEWQVSESSLNSTVLADELIQPGESRYLKIMLNMPRQEKATTFVNNASIVEMVEYIPPKLVPDKEYANENEYKFGETINYAGLTWTVISASTPDESGNQTLTLFGSSIGNMKHTNGSSDTYKWSESLINKYLNGTWLTGSSSGSNVLSANSTLNSAILHDNVICDDASGLPVKSYGGTLKGTSACQSEIYTVSKVRLLTETEFEELKKKIQEENLTNATFLNGTYWLQNSADKEQKEYNSYGVEQNPVNKKAKYVSYPTIVEDNAYANHTVRPVITISRNNIIPE